jgi:phosphatidate cytidylyltransferase
VSRLAARIAVAVLFIPVLVLAIRAGGIPLLVLVEIMVLLGLAEFYALAERCGIRPRRILGLAGAAGILMAMAGYLPWDPAQLLLLTTMVLLLVGTIKPGTRFTLGTAVTLLGILYVALAFGHVLTLRRLGPAGWRLALLPFALTWSCDTGAYFVGSTFGRHRMAPAISPRKSWEGGAAGLLASVGAAFLSRSWFAPFLSLQHCLELGAILGVLAQAGDLVESRIKREACVDDSSGLVPGHGGVLDRLDSLLFAVPATYCYLRARGIP